MNYTGIITSKGQITIPKDIRQALGLKPGDRANFRLQKSGAVVMERPMTLEQVREMLKHPEGAKLTAKEKLVLEGMKIDGHKAFR